MMGFDEINIQKKHDKKCPLAKNQHTYFYLGVRYWHCYTLMAPYCKFRRVFMEPSEHKITNMSPHKLLQLC